jgi:hypothetical protein
MGETMMTATEARSAAADRQEITEQIYRYARSMDRRDVELGYQVFHDDAVADYGEGFYAGTGHGFIDWVTELHLSFITHSHQMTNILIELDGDRAASETYAFINLRQQQGDQLLQITSWCRYLDTWSYRSGRWAIDKRLLVHDLAEVRPVTAFATSGGARRDKGDPSYAVFAGR